MRRCETQAEDEATIRRLDAAWVKIAALQDPDAWVAFYADDATVLPPNEKAADRQGGDSEVDCGLLSLPNLSA